ncbi:MAG: response regulator [Saccharofermentans sp.]|nr:response regulator [Saccharofermentans sp.]
MFNVLIVEDDPMVAMINKQYVMQHNDFRIAGMCRDGASALDFLKKNKIDLIVLDQYMPQMSGQEVLREIRKSELAVQVIMVTAANDTATIEAALRLGIVDYLIKPFSNSRFNQALDNFKNRMLTLNEAPMLNQKMIDDMISLNSANNMNSNELPKGIQAATLERLREYMKERADIELTVEDIADDIGVSRVTVRRYMNYFLERREIMGRMNYETGGRPSMLYRFIE